MKRAIGALLGRNYWKVPKLYSFIVLVVKAIIFNIKVFVAHSDRALRNPPCSNDVTYLKKKMASGPACRTLRLLGKVQVWHKAHQAWCAMEFLLILSKTNKETFARCLSISGHSNSSRSLSPQFCITRCSPKSVNCN